MDSGIRGASFTIEALLGLIWNIVDSDIRGAMFNIEALLGLIWNIMVRKLELVASL